LRETSLQAFAVTERLFALPLASRERFF